MHRTVLNGLPEKSLKEIIKLFVRILWHNFFYPKLNRLQNQNKPINPETQKLHLEAHRLKGELTLLESDLQALPFIKGSILERNLLDKRTNKLRNFHVLRWHEEGIRKEKYIVKVKKKDGDLSLPDAQQLINNAERAESLKAQIKERQRQLILTENRLTVLTGQKVEIREINKETISQLLVGRDEEFAKLQNNLMHNIPTLIIGEPGIGKSTLAKALIDSQEKPCLRIENLKAARNVLVDQVIAQIHQDQKLQFSEEDNYSVSLSLEELKSKCLKNKSITQLAELIRDSIVGSEYIIVIDSMAGLTQANQIIIDKLLETGVPLIACANRLKDTIELESIYRKFSRLELEPLPSSFIRSLLKPKIDSLMAGEYEKGLLETKIVNVACGNPGVAEKMFKDAQALSMSGSLSVDRVYSIQEPELPRRYFDLTPIVIMSIAGFAVLRFIGIGTNDTLLYVMGGIAFVVLMAFGRVMIRAWQT